MNSYENVLIFTPKMTDEEVKTAIGKYRESLESLGGKIVHENVWGLRQLAYPIKKLTTGHYIVTEYQAPSNAVARMEILYKRDERILRFLTVSLDKFAVDYNERKRNGMIGRKKQKDDDTSASASQASATTVADEVLPPVSNDSAVSNETQNQEGGEQ